MEFIIDTLHDSKIAKTRLFTWCEFESIQRERSGNKAEKEQREKA